MPGFGGTVWRRDARHRSSGVVVVGLAVVAVARAVRRAAGAPDARLGDDDGQVSQPSRAYVYKLQLALGRSARGVQQRLDEFATNGDTSTEAGLAALLQQSALELLREKDRPLRRRRRRGTDEPDQRRDEDERPGAGRAVALPGRARARGRRRVKRSEAAAEGPEALELVVVTMIVATRTPLATSSAPARTRWRPCCRSWAACAGRPLGLEVVWTPADPRRLHDRDDVMTTLPGAAEPRASRGRDVAAFAGTRRSSH